MCIGVHVAKERCPGARDAFPVASECQDKTLGPSINECFPSSQFPLGDLCGAVGNGHPYPP